jgi:LPS-assembly protein
MMYYYNRDTNIARRFLPYNSLSGNYKVLTLLSLLIFIIFSALVSSFAEGNNSYVVDADTVEYDNIQNVLVARGNVDVVTEGYRLKSDKIIYYKNTNRAYAYGNVQVIYANEDTINSDFIELDNNAKEIIAYMANALLDKENRFIAETVQYSQEGVTVFKNVSYTPCPVCEGRSPQWQVSASTVVYQKERDVSYWNNLFKIYGVPVFYLPYMRAPSPDAPSKSGFMIPHQYQSNRVYGHSISVPYYLRMSDNKDLLYSPMITSKKGIIHRAQFRHLLEKGSYSLVGNYIKTNKTSVSAVPDHRYHVAGELSYGFNDRWSANAKLDRASDKAYLHNYWQESPNYLNSNIEILYRNGYDYGSIESYVFQGLRSTDSKSADVTVLPLLRYHKSFASGHGNYTFDYNAVNILRDSGVRSNRASANVAWEKTYYYNYQEIKIRPNMQVDLYNFQNKDQTDSLSSAPRSKNQVIRSVPSLELKWRYPLISRHKKGEFYLEPTIDMVVSPNNSQNDKIINEDSQEVEISDSNLFSRNRYAGFDRIETGTRVSYGLFASGVILDNFGYTALVGQSYRMVKDDSYTVDSGMYNRHFSDYVGRVGMDLSKNLELYIRTRIDAKNYDLRRGEIGANVGFDIGGKSNIDRIAFWGRHIHYNYISTASSNKVNKSTSINGRVDFAKEWFVGAEVTLNGTRSKNFLVGSKIDIGYKGECSTFRISLLKDYTKDLNIGIKPTRGFLLDFEVHLKNIN